eukprot:MONOS_320.1-p1 / transcript=MONOS_320.1 / gene=MONOS_320 / organism=Monocercomonoides_exilis_PA203 / gene_product=unspecified product / transcript_product=unspecified product / location=Mono_scaffold00005:141504-145320(-) / protein_length=558 / sequence_SO=supercontig / SO=protein_coding / is_pseudo=false
MATQRTISVSGPPLGYTPLAPNDKLLLKQPHPPPIIDLTWKQDSIRPKPSSPDKSIPSLENPGEIIRISEPVDPSAPIPGRISPNTREIEKLNHLSTLTQQIQESIELVQDQCFEAAKGEKQLARQFKDRISEAEREIDELKKKEPEFDAMYWMKKFKEASKELDLMRGEAIRLDRLNDLMEKELKMVRVELQSSQAECESLTKKIFSVKKENKLLQDQLDQLRPAESSSPPAVRSDSFDPIITRSFTSSISQTTRPRPSNLRGSYAPSSPSTLTSRSQRGHNEGWQTTRERTAKSRRSASIGSKRGSMTARSFGSTAASVSGSVSGSASMSQSSDRITLPQLSFSQTGDFAEQTFRAEEEDHRIEEKKREREKREEKRREKREEREREREREHFSSAEARRRTMELLLSRSRVLDILNDKTFPNVTLLTSGLTNISGKSEKDLFESLFARERAEMALEQQKEEKSWLQQWHASGNGGSGSFNRKGAYRRKDNDGEANVGKMGYEKRNADNVKKGEEREGGEVDENKSMDMNADVGGSERKDNQSYGAVNDNISYDQ